MTFFSEYQSLFQSLNQKTKIITANQRMSRFLQLQWQSWQRQFGGSHWTTLDCVSFSIWLDELWQAMLLAGVPEELAKTEIQPHQQRKIWASIIEEDLQSLHLLSTEALVDTAEQAWKSLRRWNKSSADLDTELPEAQWLKKWIDQFQERCDAQNIMDEVAKQNCVIQCLEQSFPRNIERLIFVGFDSLSPLDQTFLEQLESVGIAVEHFDVSLESSASRVAVGDTLQEIESAACWAAQCLQEPEPPQSIGIVIPNLADLRAEVETIFHRVFDPQMIRPGQVRQAPGFNISAGQPLGQTPIIQIALELLRWVSQPIPVDCVGRILMSPFLWGGRDELCRWQFAQSLLSVAEELTLAQCCDWLAKQAYVQERDSVDAEEVDADKNANKDTDGEETDDAKPSWLEQLPLFAEAGQRWLEGGHTYSSWTTCFNELLAIAGWARFRTLDTLEYQQLSHWPRLMEAMAELDRVSGAGPIAKIGFSQALQELSRLTYTPFHPQTKTSPIQILGLLEAAGMQFDALWVMGLDYRVWPEPCQPNPLIPIYQQKQWKMPRAVSEKELTLAKLLTKRLQHSAYDVIFSYPTMDGDQPLRPSPLIEHLTEVSLEHKVHWQVTTHYDANPSVPMDVLDDHIAYPINALSSISGGSQIIKNQALCPFKAFAQHRLNLAAVDRFQPGMTPLLRGNLIHKSLELVWRQLKDQETLLSLTDTESTALVALCVQSAWEQLDGVESIGEKVKTLEVQRSEELVSSWLALEKQRAPFVVEFHEKSEQMKIEGLIFNVRYDRSDRIVDGQQRMVIDYKTGQTDIKKWFGDRPEEPQVPLYTLINSEDVQAAALAQINRHDISLSGVCADPDGFDDLTPVEKLDKWSMPTTWEDLVAFWDATLRGLAKEFCDGYAAVQPKNPPVSCTFCDFKSVCRIAHADAVSQPTGETNP